MADILEEIVQKTRERLKTQKSRRPLADLEKRIAGRKKPLPFAAALHASEGLTVIAELKQSSPSAGVIREESDMSGRVRGYARGGAAALSILTEENYFSGSPDILELARKETDLPLLRKDFIIDPYQIEESRAMGADAILLITTLLPPALLKELLDHVREIGLDALVEMHDEKDLEKAMKAGAPLLGVNHRNLRTLQMDLSLSQKLLPLIPKGKTVVVESGIKEPEDLARFRALGAHAVLIGETLMRDPNPEAIVRSFVEAGHLAKKEIGMTKIKICGITNTQDALWAVNLGADYIGLNFYPPSPRKISPKNAKEIVGQLPPFVIPVGIFVDETLPAIAKLVKSTPLKAVQLHGSETPEFCRDVKALGVQVIKVIALEGPLNVSDLSAYADGVDFFLFDSRSSDTPGGTGQTFEWDWLQTAGELGKPWFLAGGLSADNVGDAIKKAHPPAVDVCSGIERLPSRKDFESMKRFIQTVRSAR